MNQLDTTLEEAVAVAVAEHLTSGVVFVLHRRDLAKHAALDAFRQASAAAVNVVSEMAADYEQAGDTAGAAILRKAERLIATLPGDLP